MASYSYRNVAPVGLTITWFSGGGSFSHTIPAAGVYSFEADTLSPETLRLVTMGYLISASSVPYIPDASLIATFGTPLIFRGTYSPEQAYKTGHTATFGGSLYLSLSPNYNASPSENPGGWMALMTDISGSSHPLDSNNPHNTTAAQVGAVALGAVGAANGVAELDGDGKLPSARLPAISGLHDQNTDTALAIGTGNEVTAAALKAHLVNLSNPHSVTCSQIGAVENTLLGAPLGVATLDSSGKLNSAQVPVTATGDVRAVNTIVQRDALASSLSAGSKVAVRDTNKVYLWNGTAFSDVTTSNAWTFFVNGYSGTAIVLTTNDVAESGGKLYFTEARLIATAAFQAVDDASHDQNTDTALALGSADEVTASALRAHLDNTLNPHNVTAAQVGALAAVADDGSPSLAANLDAATFKVVNLGAPSADGDAATKGYVDDLYDALTGGGVTEVNGHPGPVVTLVKGDIGLGNVDNTSDLNKPISTATQAALDTHTHAESGIVFSDVTTGNASTLKHGFMPKLSGNAAEAFRGDGSWGAVSATGGGGNTDEQCIKITNTAGSSLAAALTAWVSATDAFSIHVRWRVQTANPTYEASIVGLVADPDIGTPFGDQSFFVGIDTSGALVVRLKSTGGNHRQALISSFITNFGGDVVDLVVARTAAGVLTIIIDGTNTAFTESTSGGTPPAWNNTITATYIACGIANADTVTTSSNRVTGEFFAVRFFNRVVSAAEAALLGERGVDASELNASDSNLTNDVLEAGRRYRIVSFSAGDNFTTAGAAANTAGTEFVANTGTPTWSNGSVLKRVGPIYDLDFQHGTATEAADRTSSNQPTALRGFTVRQLPPSLSEEVITQELTNKSDVSHTHNENDITFADNTIGNTTASQHGFMPKLSGNAADVFHGDGSWSTPGAGGSTPSWNDQDITCLTATAQGHAIATPGLTATPVGRVDVFINTQRYIVGSGVKTKGVYFSGDGGTTARAHAAIVAGDTCHLGTTGAAIGGTSTSDTVSFCYNL